jgi:hypothetical protein
MVRLEIVTLKRESPPMYTTYSIAMVSLIAVGLATFIVFLHYEVLNLLARVLSHLAWVGRPRIAILFGTLLIVHIVEIWIFACGYRFAEWHGGLGQIKGQHEQAFLDYVYYLLGDLYHSGLW